MAEVVDSIIAQLEVRLGNYVTNFNQAADAHERFTKTRPDKVGQFSTAEVDQYANRHKTAANDVAASEEQATAKVTRTRKARSDAVRQADAADVASAEAAARQRDAIAEREARRDASAARRVIQDNRVQPAAAGSSRIGATVAREGTGQSSIPLAVLAGGESVAAETEVNHILADRATLQGAVTTLKGAEKREAQDMLAAMRLENQLRAAGLADEEIALRLEEQRGRVAARNALEAKATSSRSGARGAEQFARGAGFYAATGGAAAVAGIGVAAAAYGGAEAIGSSLAYAKQISDTAATTGVSTQQLQVYQTAARQAGATNEQLATSFGHLNDYIGRAKEGDEQAAKTFKVLGINIKDFASAGDALPTLLNRLAQIKDPADRAAVGTRLFSEEYKRLDAVLGQGTGKIDALAASLQKAGAILPDSDLKKLHDAQIVLDGLKNTMSVDLARVVAGNTQAILGLANAFFKAADAALHFAAAKDRAADIGVLDKNRNLFNRDRTDQISNLLTQGDGSLATAQRQAFQRQLSDHDGRQALYSLNRQEARDLDSRASIGPDGKDRLDVDRKRNEDERQQILRTELADRQSRKTPPITPGKTGNISDLFAPKGPKGPADKTPDQLAAEQAERTKAYLDRLAGLQETQLRAQESLTGDITKQAAIEGDLADRALAKLVGDGTKKNPGDIELTRQRNIDRINAEHAPEAAKQSAIALENAHAKELTEAAKAADATQRQVTAQETSVKLINAANQHLQTQLSIDAEIINTQAALATTRKDRLALELKALDNQKQQEKLNLETQLKTLKPGDPARDDVQKRLGSLDTVYGGKAEQTRQGNLSPLDAYRKQLQGAVGDTNDALEQVQVNALQKVDDQLSSTIGKVLGLKGAFGDLATSIIEDLAKIEIKKGILALLGGRGGSGSDSGDSSPDAGGSSGGGFFGSIFSAISGARASGGGVVGGSTYLVGEHGPELFTAAQSGRIVPNNSVVAPAGAMTVVQHISVDGRNSVTPADFANQIVRTANAHANRVAAQAGQAAVNAAPARVTQVQTLGS